MTFTSYELTSNLARRGCAFTAGSPVGELNCETLYNEIEELTSCTEGQGDLAG